MKTPFIMQDGTTVGGLYVTEKGIVVDDEGYEQKCFSDIIVHISGDGSVFTPVGFTAIAIEKEEIFGIVKFQSKRSFASEYAAYEWIAQQGVNETMDKMFKMYEANAKIPIPQEIIQ